MIHLSAKAVRKRLGLFRLQLWVLYVRFYVSCNAISNLSATFTISISLPGDRAHKRQWGKGKDERDETQIKHTPGGLWLLVQRNLLLRVHGVALSVLLQILKSLLEAVRNLKADAKHRFVNSTNLRWKIEAKWSERCLIVKAEFSYFAFKGDRNHICFAVEGNLM